jgi:hypothetical protein
MGGTGVGDACGAGCIGGTCVDSRGADVGSAGGTCGAGSTDGSIGVAGSGGGGSLAEGVPPNAPAPKSDGALWAGGVGAGSEGSGAGGYVMARS